MSTPRIGLHVGALALFSGLTVYYGVVVPGGLRTPALLLVGVIAPAMALYEWFNAYKSTPEAQHVADRLMSIFVIAMFGLASVAGVDIARSEGVAIDTNKPMPQ
jgi:hypothetical protein